MRTNESIKAVKVFPFQCYETSSLRRACSSKIQKLVDLGLVKGKKVSIVSGTLLKTNSM